MNEDILLKPLTPDVGDAAHAIITKFLEGIPVAGPSASLLFNWFIQAPLEDRRDEWMREVGQRLLQLEKNERGILYQLQSDPMFIDTLLQATHIAMRNTSETKRVALLNAVMNSSKPRSPDAARRHFFLRWIDDFTDYHLQVLALLHSPVDFLQSQGIKLGAQDKFVGIEVWNFLFPELRDHHGIIVQVWSDLLSANLIQKSEYTHVMLAHPIKPSIDITPAADAFMAFISGEPSTRPGTKRNDTIDEWD